MKTTTECDYLSGEGPEGMGALRHLALYKSHDVARGRAVYALRLPLENKCACCTRLTPILADNHIMYIHNVEERLEDKGCFGTAG